MRDEIRNRFFTPFVLPLTVIGVMLLIGVSLSRVLLAVSELSAALVALLAAGYIMAMAFYVEARRRIPARTLGVAMAVGLVGLLGAGAVASAAGIREIEHGEASAEGGGEEGDEAAGGGEPVFVAVDIAYDQAPETLPVGTTTVTIDNQGTIDHNVVFEELGDELIVEAAGGDSASGDVTLDDAGEYTYYCSVAGHREAGMEGTLTADESAGGEEGATSGDATEESTGAPTDTGSAAEGET